MVFDGVATPVDDLDLSTHGFGSALPFLVFLSRFFGLFVWFLPVSRLFFFFKFSLRDFSQNRFLLFMGEYCFLRGFDRNNRRGSWVLLLISLQSRERT